MSGELSLFNRQRSQPVDLRQLRKVINHFLNDLLVLKEFDLTVHLAGEREMTQLNEKHLRHAGSTDVITFDYSSAGPEPLLAGELFVCLDEAVIQARLFRATWPEELVRYIVHGVLHLQGHDDLHAAPRRRMKCEEDRLVRELAADFDLSKLRRKTKIKL